MVPQGFLLSCDLSQARPRLELLRRQGCPLSALPFFLSLSCREACPSCVWQLCQRRPKLPHLADLAGEFPLLEPASWRSKVCSFSFLFPPGGGLAFAFFARVALGRGSGSPDCGITFFNHSSPQGNLCTERAGVLDAGLWKTGCSTVEAQYSRGPGRQGLEEGCGGWWVAAASRVWGDLAVAWEGDWGGVESFCPIMEFTVFLT